MENSNNRIHKRDVKPAGLQCVIVMVHFCGPDAFNWKKVKQWKRTNSAERNVFTQ